MAYWLMKSEPSAYSLDDLKRDGTTPWDGVRNYQARNFMRDQMQVGDSVLFYHSNAKPPGVAGLARVASAAYPDATAWQPDHPHFDSRSTPAKPVWFLVDIAYTAHFQQFVSLEQIRQHPELQTMLVVQKGSRLSIQPVTAAEFTLIQVLGAG